ncbi:hypothetical protein ACWDCL_00160 [Streptomyces sp. NPDC001009]
MGIVIETHIRADLDELWARTQDPARRQRWDLRFTRLHHLPRTAAEPDGAVPFRYATRVLPFLTVLGTGVAAAEPERPDGTRAAAQRFAAPHPLSPFAETTAHWRYLPDAHGVRLRVRYDHRPRGGAPGAFADRLLVRPLAGWAAAWSVDRLRLWLEHGITPERALRTWLAGLALRALVLLCCLLGLGLEPFAGLGPLSAAGAFLCPLLLLAVACAALCKAPPRGAPAARRCVRTPLALAGTPRLLETLRLPSAP